MLEPGTDRMSLLDGYLECHAALDTVNDFELHVGSEPQYQVIGGGRERWETHPIFSK